MPKSSSSNIYCTWENPGVLFHNYLTITLKNKPSQNSSGLIAHAWFQVSRLSETQLLHCLAALLPLSKCVTLMYLLCYFFPLNLSHFYTSSLVGMKKTYLIKVKKPQTTKSQTAPTETTQLPMGLKAEFQGKSSCVPCQKQGGSRNIQWNTRSQTECRKIPPS